MKIERSKVEKMTITGAKSLDPITVYAEDIGPRQGKVTIECYGKSWSAYWGGCGDKGVIAFVLSCNVDYIVNCLDRGIEPKKYDPYLADIVMKADLLKRRRNASIWKARDWRIDTIETKEEARKWWERIEEEIFSSDPANNADLIMRFYDVEEWWAFLPESKNPDYVYLCRIVQAVQQALAEAPITQEEVVA